MAQQEANNLLAAFNSLAESIREVSIGNAVKQAQQKIDVINADNKATEFEKIRQQQTIANQVAANMIGYGADAARAQQARLALAPQIPEQWLSAAEAESSDGTIAEGIKNLQGKKFGQEVVLKQLGFAHDDKRLAAMKEIAVIKANAQRKKAETLGAIKSDELSAFMGRAGQWEAIADKAEKLGWKNITPAALGDDKYFFEIMKNSSAAELRKELFGASLTTGEASAFDSLMGSYVKAGFSAERFAEGLRKIGEWQRRTARDRLLGYASGGIGTKEQIAGLTRSYANKLFVGKDKKQVRNQYAEYIKQMKNALDSRESAELPDISEIMGSGSGSGGLFSGGTVVEE